MERRVLGKGLDALIPKRTIVNEQPAVAGLNYLPITQLQPSPYQPRHEFDQKDLEELAGSIKMQGLLQPILVRKLGPEKYEIVAGQRRYEAAKILKLEQIPAIIKELSDQDTLTLAIIENLQRKDLNPIDEAQAFLRLMEEFSFSLDDLARVVSKDKTTISNTLRLLKLPRSIQDGVRQGLISRSQARTILALVDPLAQEKLFHQILQSGISVRDLEEKVRKVSRNKTVKASDTHIRELEEQLAKFFGTKVKIAAKRNNKGKIIIDFFSLNDFDRILAKLKI